MLCFFPYALAIKSILLYKLIAISLPMHEFFTISCVMLYHLLNSTLHSKANAFLDFICNCGWKKTKLFAYRFYKPFTQQCTFHLVPDNFKIKKEKI